MLLENKNAVIYGDGGKVRSPWPSPSRGAKVFLTGRTLESLEEIAPSNKRRR